MRHVISIGGREFANGIRLGLSETPGVTVVEIPIPTISPDLDVEEAIITAFSQVVDAIEGLVASESCSDLLNAIAVVDFWDSSLSSLEEINPISSTAGPLSVVVGMLLLVFPEVHWCFNTQHKNLGTYFFCDSHVWHSHDHPESIARVCALNYNGYAPLFDPTGIRNTIRENIKRQEEDGVPVAPNIELRRQLAAVIEEEQSYAYLHAYTAYKFGFRVNMITSFGMMNKFMKSVPAESPKTGVCENHISLLFEDLYLNFPDRDPHFHFRLSRLPERDKAFPNIDKVLRRVIITTGHHGRQQDQDTWKINKTYLEDKQAENRFIEMIFKPGAGIFDTWKRSKLATDLPNGKALGYRQANGRRSKSALTTGGHSSPGRLLAIAECLIRRSRRLRHEGKTVAEAIYGAVLALEAQEYLGERTPTTSLEAMALKHETEVVAESMFYGIQYNIDIASRFDELSKEISSVGQWFQPKTRKVSMLNAEIRILSRLLRSFRENGQFDEEQQCLNRIRKVHRSLWLRRYRAWVWLVWIPRLYVEFLLGSLYRFGWALAVCVGLFALIYFFLLPDPTVPQVAHLNAWHGLEDAATAFFGMQPPHDFDGLIKEYPTHQRTIIAVTLAAIGASFIHLGIFISHLYSMVSRR